MAAMVDESVVETELRHNAGAVLGLEDAPKLLRETYKRVNLGNYPIFRSRGHMRVEWVRTRESMQTVVALAREERVFSLDGEFFSDKTGTVETAFERYSREPIRLADPTRYPVFYQQFFPASAQGLRVGQSTIIQSLLTGPFLAVLVIGFANGTVFLVDLIAFSNFLHPVFDDLAALLTDSAIIKLGWATRGDLDALHNTLGERFSPDRLRSFVDLQAFWHEKAWCQFVGLSPSHPPKLKNLCTELRGFGASSLPVLDSIYAGNDLFVRELATKDEMYCVLDGLHHMVVGLETARIVLRARSGIYPAFRDIVAFLTTLPKDPFFQRFVDRQPKRPRTLYQFRETEILAADLSRIRPRLPSRVVGSARALPPAPNSDISRSFGSGVYDFPAGTIVFSARASVALIGTMATPQPLPMVEVSTDECTFRRPAQEDTVTVRYSHSLRAILTVAIPWAPPVLPTLPDLLSPIWWEAQNPFATDTVCTAISAVAGKVWFAPTAGAVADALLQAISHQARPSDGSSALDVEQANGQYIRFTVGIYGRLRQWATDNRDNAPSAAEVCRKVANDVANGAYRYAFSSDYRPMTRNQFEHMRSHYAGDGRSRRRTTASRRYLQNHTAPGDPVAPFQRRPQWLE